MSGLRILITNLLLTGRTGTETYVYDLALALAARGHTPLVYTRRCGALADALRANGLEVCDSLTNFSRPPDLVHGHHTIPTLEALLHFRDVPGVYVCHDATYHIDTPPLFPRILRYLAVDFRCRERLERSGVSADRIGVVHNAVDLNRYLPRAPLPERPERALLFSNYANESTHLPAVREACELAGLPLDVVGSGVGQLVAAPEQVLGRYDLVFAKARCALEAMAVGPAVILCDYRGLGGMVTRADVEEFRRWNFGARVLTRPFDPLLIKTEIGRYNAADASAVSQWVRKVAGLDALVDQLVAVYEDVRKEWENTPCPTPRQEARAAAAAFLAARSSDEPIRVRDRLRHLPGLGPWLVSAKRAVFGPRE